MKKLKGVALMALSMMAAQLAMAVPVEIDTAEAVGQIGEASTAISAIGVALISLAALVLGYRWVKANFF